MKTFLKVLWVIAGIVLILEMCIRDSNYDEVHVIDFRYYSGSLKQYCSDNGITEVLFLNGVMSANTPLETDDR